MLRFRLSVYCIIMYVLYILLRLTIFISLFWPCWVFVAAHGLSLVAGSGGSSLAVVCRLLVVVASLVAECRLWGVWAAVAAIPGP